MNKIKMNNVKISIRIYRLILTFDKNEQFRLDIQKLCFLVT